MRKGRNAEKMEWNTNYAAPGSLAHRTACNIRLQNSNWPPGDPKMANIDFDQLSVNMFFDLSTPFMRKGVNRE